MATTALTTSARSSHLASAPRSLTTDQGRPTVNQSGLGCVILDGEGVFFDTNEYPAVGAPALVVFGDGRMEVVPMPSMDDDPMRGMNHGFIKVRVNGPKVGDYRIAAEQAALIGAVRDSR